METDTITLSEVLMLNIYLGSVTYILGIVFQILIVFLNKSITKKFIKVLFLLVLTLLCAIVTSTLFWYLWFSKIDMMFGPISLPVLISEIILSPLILRLNGYKILKRK